MIQEILFARVALLHVNFDTVKLTAEAFTDLHKLCRDKSIKISRLSEWTSVWNQDSSIVTYLNLSLNSAASDPRDQVFAITSLLAPEIRGMITVDYSMTEDEVFTQAVTACAAECKDLDLICFSDLPADEDLISTPTFTKAHLQDFLTFRTSDKTSKKSHSGLFQSRLRSPWLPNSTIEMPTQLGEPPILHTAPLHGHGSTFPSHVEPEVTSTIAIRGKISVPKFQILPCLTTRAHLIDICIGSHGLQVDQLVQEYEARYGEKEIEEWLREHLLLEVFTSIRVFKIFDFDKEFRRFSISSDLHHFVSDMRTALRDTVQRSGESAKTLVMFHTHYSVGFSSCTSLPGDVVFAIDGAHSPLLLRPIPPNELSRSLSDPAIYRIVGSCYLWAAMNLDYWNPGSRQGVWIHKPYDLGSQQTRTITIY